ncbi:MAG TPA: hypothetical protein PKM63_04280 [Panacibacter sp.]|nr:hypothetical protein [Panacibacter sp.]HNP43477.1 hypothetical protein [Panacibacter sp.]
MKKTISALFAVLVFALSANAQNNSSSYKTALGIKFYPGAISLKTFNKPNRAFEGLAYIYGDGIRFTGLYEIHGDINGADGLKWYIGPGAHIGFFNDGWKKDHPDENSTIAIGVDGVLGLDYKISGAPINVSLDWQPSFNFVGYNSFEAGWGGLGVRYTF